MTGVVVVFEVIDIGDDQREGLTLLRVQRDQRIQELIHTPSIGQVGQPVGISRVLHLSVRC